MGIHEDSGIQYQIFTTKCVYPAWAFIFVYFFKNYNEQTITIDSLCWFVDSKYGVLLDGLHN